MFLQNTNPVRRNWKYSEIKDNLILIHLIVILTQAKVGVLVG